jgi:hypothetical protein
VSDLSKFERLNVADTCSLWNVLGSRLLREAARSAGVSLCITEFVRYECLHKPGRFRPERTELQSRLRHEMTSGAVGSYSLEVEDLQELSVLESRRRLSKGELSSVVLAKKTRQAVMTDDRKARKLAISVLPSDRVQTTAHLFGWLYFCGRLLDGDRITVEVQLAEVGRSLAPHFENAYLEALRCKLMAKAEQITESMSAHTTAGE